MFNLTQFVHDGAVVTATLCAIAELLGIVELGCRRFVDGGAS